MGYTYQMIQVPPAISIASKEQKGNEAAMYLQDVVNNMAEKGWEFYRVDSIAVQVQPGCVGGFFGKQAVDHNYYVITFRRPA